MSRRSVAPRPEVVDRELAATQVRTAVCLDPACGAAIDQPLTGRPRSYCDATCRKNAARQRAWRTWREEIAAWRERDAQRQAESNQRQADWDRLPVPVMLAWQDKAHRAGWTPPGGVAGWMHQLKVDAYGPRPADYRTPKNDPEPQTPPGYRQGAKGSYW